MLKSILDGSDCIFTHIEWGLAKTHAHVTAPQSVIINDEIILKLDLASCQAWEQPTTPQNMYHVSPNVSVSV